MLRGGSDSWDGSGIVWSMGSRGVNEFRRVSDQSMLFLSGMMLQET